MLSDKKTGAVFAENEEEATWFRLAEGIRGEIKMLKMRNISANKDLKLGDREIGQKFRNGARATIKANLQNMMIQKEFLKIAKSKIKRNI